MTLDTNTFSRMVLYIQLLGNAKRDAQLLDTNMMLSRGFYDIWFDMESSEYDPRLDYEPPLELPDIAFVYWWLKVWFYLHHMSLDQLNEVQAFANQEMLYIQHHLFGYGLSPVSFMPMIMENINLAIAVDTSKVAYKSFIIMMLCRERCNAHSSAFAIMVANLPSNTLKLIGDALFKKYKDSQDSMYEELCMR